MMETILKEIRKKQSNKHYTGQDVETIPEYVLLC